MLSAKIDLIFKSRRLPTCRRHVLWPLLSLISYRLSSRSLVFLNCGLSLADRKGPEVTKLNRD
jgi:hypothetical protein